MPGFPCIKYPSINHLINLEYVLTVRALVTVYTRLGMCCLLATKSNTILVSEQTSVWRKLLTVKQSVNRGCEITSPRSREIISLHVQHGMKTFTFPNKL